MRRNMTRKSSKRSSKCSKRSAKVSPIAMPLQPIKCCQRIAPKERLFLDAAERGDRHTMYRCLQPPEPVNVNCTNMLGRSAIQIAVDNENVEICELLLRQDGVKIGDALLYAIREGVFKIVEMLIDHPSITPEMLGNEWSKSKYVGEESNDYSPDVSPVILAAHCNQFEILQLLLMRGAAIDRPHQLSCSCRRCQEKVHEDSLRHSLRRINAYRALASPAWISLTSSDPILTAFDLSRELKNLALRENEFKDTYLELSNQCKKCACDMLDQCRTTEEVIAVLNKSKDSYSETDDYDEFGTGKLTLSRLKLAIKYEQKEFVAHPNCQQLLTSIWYEGLPGWRKRNALSKMCICLGLILIMPFMAFYYWVFPRSRIGKLLRSPFMKFVYHSASFGAFLILLICTSMEVSSIKGRERLRGPPPTEFEWLICIWITGFIWSECKQLWEEGLKAYIRQWWNWLDFIMLSLYLTTFTLRFLAYFQIESGKYGPRELERKYWPLYDPTMVSEGLFAIANVFSFARIIFLCQADQYLGPLQISLGCMLIDIAKFLFIFFLVITSFACGLNQLYWYYTPSPDVKISSFHSLENSYRTLYWSLFSMTQVKDIKIQGGQLFTEIVGELLFMAYQTMAVIVLINMLIAMMSSSFQEIENHADMEWKFTRSKLWMGYFDEGSTLPPPFNIVVSPKSIICAGKVIKELFCKCCPETFSKTRRKFKPSAKGLKTAGSSTVHLNGASAFRRPVSNGDTRSSFTSRQITLDVRYEDIMRRLVTRYIHQTKKQKRQDGVNEDDLLEIKQDISSLRYEIREDRQRETLRYEEHFDRLRSDLLTALKSTVSSTDDATDRIMHQRPADDTATVRFTDYNGGNVTQRRSNSVKRGLFCTKTDEQGPFNSTNNSHSKIQIHNVPILDDRPANYTAAKIESYLHHLGEDCSTPTSVTCPLPNMTNDPYQSHTGAFDIPKATSYGYRLYTSGTDADVKDNQLDKNEQIPGQIPVNLATHRTISQTNLNAIKLEILASLRSELRDTVTDLACNRLQPSASVGNLPDLSSDLYQTHLYTQL